MFKFYFSLTLLIFIFSSSALAQSEQVIAGKQISATCAACHGPKGNTTNPIWPKLAGQHKKYLIKQLMNFKNGQRENATMSAMAAGLSKQNIEDLAAYFASQIPTYGRANAELVKLGEKIYRGGISNKKVSACIACHGPNGRGNALASYPTLAGQNTQYVEAQLKAFRDDQRHNDLNKMMRATTKHMTDTEILAVASYVEGLH